MSLGRLRYRLVCEDIRGGESSHQIGRVYGSHESVHSPRGILLDYDTHRCMYLRLGTLAIKLYPTKLLVLPRLRI